MFVTLWDAIAHLLVCVLFLKLVSWSDRTLEWVEKITSKIFIAFFLFYSALFYEILKALPVSQPKAEHGTPCKGSTAFMSFTLSWYQLFIWFPIGILKHCFPRGWQKICWCSFVLKHGEDFTLCIVVYIVLLPVVTHCLISEVLLAADFSIYVSIWC